MIRAKLEYNTNHLNYYNKCYCSYCGKEIKADTEIDNHESFDYYHCDCEDALKEIELYKEIKKLEERIIELKSSMPKAKYGIVKKVLIEEIK